MRYLLDTNVIFELRKVGDGKADPNVTAWIGAHDARDLYISAITILELERGILSMQPRHCAGLSFTRMDGWLGSPGVC